MHPTTKAISYLRCILVFVILLLANANVRSEQWKRHTIDDSSQGADGVRLADINGDGRLDIATGWEEGGLVRIYLSPDHTAIREPWPAIDVGHVAQPEDAVFVDADNDGHMDVVSCCEGNNRSVYVHWNPGTETTHQWTTDAFPQLRGRHPWMFCMPLADNAGQTTELVVGSKGGHGEIGRMLPPLQGDLRELSNWTWSPLGPAAWVMSIRTEDINDDGFDDIVYSDRRPPNRGIHAWLRPSSPAKKWQMTTIGANHREVMFVDIADLNNDGLRDIVCNVRGGNVLILLKVDRTGKRWNPIEAPLQSHVGTGKGVALGDINGDGKDDLVCTCEHAEAKTGVYWLSRTANDVHAGWQFHDISGSNEGIKFDRIELMDFDQDGDLDVLTCEERDNLGVIWYENPQR